ncbi:MAG: SPOR domain-containing protein [Paracoccaceae bacterium]|uniref:SPOR domain-containing protein n=1 Tax=Seohaeicola saemankumensis TaxID=481181 RepID=UPI001E5B3C24|nr:SPOR domain-containing protein [Seohaeicola saemankumensis]MCD1627083.1 SPOR domain-containing protein [Seohaeicola saemankumensis]
MFVRVVSFAALVVLSSFAGSAPADAQSQRYREPAEFPPASFTGTQYVDSRGCIFVRAGIGGATAWVPRVTSSRQNLCGATPTFANGAPPQTATTAQAAIPPGAILITRPQTPTARPTAEARPAQVVAPQPARVAATPPRVAAPSQPRTVNARMAPQAPVIIERPGRPMQTIASITTPPTIGKAAQAQPQTPVANRCAAAGVRCGPQTQDPTGYRSGTGPIVATPGMVVRRSDLHRLDPQTRIVPRHVAEAQAQVAGANVVPKGYRPVWTDDRLNPLRAHGTVAGQKAMELVWTDTVPRRLIDRRTGRDMTAYNPNVVYPYTDLATQTRAGVLAARNITVSTSGRVHEQPKAKPRQQVPVAQVTTRSTPQHAPHKLAARYVQVGAFANPANADGAIRRLQAAGLPVSTSNVTRKGTSMRVILAGPFASSGALSQGLGIARSAGFRDAFARN